MAAAEVLPEEEDEEVERARLEDEGEVEMVAAAREEGLRGGMTTTTMETTTKTGAEILLLAVELSEDEGGARPELARRAAAEGGQRVRELGEEGPRRLPLRRGKGTIQMASSFRSHSLLSGSGVSQPFLFLSSHLEQWNRTDTTTTVPNRRPASATSMLSLERSRRTGRTRAVRSGRARNAWTRAADSSNGKTTVRSDIVVEVPAAGALQDEPRPDPSQRGVPHTKPRR